MDLRAYETGLEPLTTMQSDHTMAAADSDEDMDWGDQLRDRASASLDGTSLL